MSIADILTNVQNPGKALVQPVNIQVGIYFFIFDPRYSFKAIGNKAVDSIWYQKLRTPSCLVVLTSHCMLDYARFLLFLMLQVLLKVNHHITTDKDIFNCDISRCCL